MFESHCREAIERNAELCLPGYELLAYSQASVGGGKILLGVRGRCRYCGTSEPTAFRKVAHTLPEGLGNKWIISLDECDVCNAHFGLYDDCLVKSVGGVLTVGGTIGKNNRVRQSGRTAGPAFISHSRRDGNRHIHMQTSGRPFQDLVRLGPIEDSITFRTPTGTERFVPRHAYKALVKMGVALLPQSELARFSNLIAWILERDDSAEMGPLIVGLSFGSVGNAPRLAAAALIQRKEPSDVLPRMIFVVSVGSVCFQIALIEDVTGCTWPGVARAQPNIRWANVLAPPAALPRRIEYGDPVHLDWCSTQLALTPVEAIETRFNVASQHTKMTPILRSVAVP